MPKASPRVGGRRAALVALLGLLCLPLAAPAQVAPPQEERPQRDEQGLAARQQRYATPTAKTVAMLPVRLIELPFQLLNFPLEHWVVKKQPDPLIARINRNLIAAEARGVSFDLRLETGHSGFGGGMGYRLPHSLTGPVNLRFFAGATNRGYQQYFAQLDTLHVGAAAVWLRGQYLELAQESFYGLGLDSDLDQRSNYERGLWSGALIGEVAGKGPVRLLFDVAYSRDDIRRGESDEFPPSQDAFSGVEGLEGQFDFVEGGASLVWERRDHPTYAEHGSYARAGAHIVGGVGETQNSFAKYYLELRQYVPLPGIRRVLGLRVAAAVTDNLADADIPFFRLERLGGSRTLRGVQTYRFTDKDMLTGGVEYRFPFWTIGLESGTAIDALVFGDVGTVLPNLEEVQWHDLKTTGGFGFRIVTGSRVLLRTDFAWSNEDSRVHIGFGSLH